MQKTSTHLDLTNFVHISDGDEEVLRYSNKNWAEIITPINVKQFKRLLDECDYDKKKTADLILGFERGFDLGYRGPHNRTDCSNNIPLKIGSPVQLWNKVMKEVAASRYAWPFTYQEIPFRNWIQSPIGLVLKAGNKTRLIFHLSYDFGDKWEQKSVNFHTPDSLCHVKYHDLDHAVAGSLRLLQLIKEDSQNQSGLLFYGKSDCSHAFRIVPILVEHRKFLLLMAKDPETLEKLYFIDLCLPFGASISCAQFQSFSDALKVITDYKLAMQFLYPPEITNYLDDFLFIAITMSICNEAMSTFLEICSIIGCPISQEKTEWATQLIVFLGVLLNGRLQILAVPWEKQVKAINLLNLAISKRKVTIKFIQKLTGTLNFLNHAIVPGRVFTRGMYSKLRLKNAEGQVLKQHHHIWFNKEFVMDCHLWLQFLKGANDNPQLLC